ncbi:MAG: hypothetical protein R3236_05150 [Phycisphaeraceae bacterium]|nr:hypothetical protein [Phycisphaeraceae bacterium]
MIHNVKNPGEDETRRKVVKKDVQETTEGNMTLRRTTIDEVEIKPDKKDKPKDATDDSSKPK